MGAAETYFLIDYENVGEEGFSGCEKLGKADHILIFFTQNAKKIDMSEIANHGNAELQMIEVPAGKQSTDIHIGSYVGFLTGTVPDKDASIVVVSKDTDYDNVIRFWKEKTGVSISRVRTIKSKLAKTTTAVQTATQAKKTVKKEAPAGSEKKTALNADVQKAMSAADLTDKVIGSVASLVASHFGKEDMLKAVEEDIRKHFKNHAAILTVIKPILKKYSGAETPSEGQNKNAVNVMVQQKLSKAGFDNEIVGSVASIVVKNIGAKDSKKTIYNKIVSAYGQKQGLEIYNRIKSFIL